MVFKNKVSFVGAIFLGAFILQCAQALVVPQVPGGVRDAGAQGAPANGWAYTTLWEGDVAGATGTSPWLDVTGFSSVSQLVLFNSVQASNCYPPGLAWKASANGTAFTGGSNSGGAIPAPWVQVKANTSSNASCAYTVAVLGVKPAS
jgi:hypothetical protein